MSRALKKRFWRGSRSTWPRTSLQPSAFSYAHSMQDTSRLHTALHADLLCSTEAQSAQHSSLKQQAAAGHTHWDSLQGQAI